MSECEYTISESVFLPCLIITYQDVPDDTPCARTSQELAEHFRYFFNIFNNKK